MWASSSFIGSSKLPGPHAAADTCGTGTQRLMGCSRLGAPGFASLGCHEGLALRRDFRPAHFMCGSLAPLPSVTGLWGPVTGRVTTVAGLLQPRGIALLGIFWVCLRAGHCSPGWGSRPSACPGVTCPCSFHSCLSCQHSLSFLPETLCWGWGPAVSARRPSLCLFPAPGWAAWGLDRGVFGSAGSPRLWFVFQVSEKCA